MFINSSSKNNNPAAKGFTLIEVIVALGIGILIMTTFMAVTALGFRNIRTINQTKKMHANAVYIINTLTYEIKQAKNLNVPEDDSSTLEIELPDPTTKTVKIIGENIKIDSIQLNNDDVKITNLEFTGMQKSVRINFTMEPSTGGQSFSITTTIAQRNNL